jgi:hypothetical protein
MRYFALLALLLFLLGGCANSNVEVSATDEDAHQQLIKEDEEGAERLTERPKVVSVPQPDFPEKPGVSGLIMVRVLVGIHGEPIEAVINQDLDPELDKAALAAAMEGSYQPGREGEIPREAWLSVPFRYPPPAPPVQE